MIGVLKTWAGFLVSLRVEKREGKVIRLMATFLILALLFPPMVWKRELAGMKLVTLTWEWMALHINVYHTSALIKRFHLHFTYLALWKPNAYRRLFTFIDNQHDQFRLVLSIDLQYYNGSIAISKDSFYGWVPSAETQSKESVKSKVKDGYQRHKSSQIQSSIILRETLTQTLQKGSHFPAILLEHCTGHIAAKAPDDFHRQSKKTTRRLATSQLSKCECG